MIRHIALLFLKPTAPLAAIDAVEATMGSLYVPVSAASRILRTLVFGTVIRTTRLSAASRTRPRSRPTTPIRNTLGYAMNS